MLSPASPLKDKDGPHEQTIAKCILVVEDEAIVAAMVEEMLSELGATIIGPAFSISEALSLAGANEIDAALLDINVNSERVHQLLICRSLAKYRSFLPQATANPRTIPPTP